jgi:hypothetical protein
MIKAEIMESPINGFLCMLLGLGIHILFKAITIAKERKASWADLWKWFREPVEVLSNVVALLCGAGLLIGKPDVVGEFTAMSAIAMGYGGTSILRNIFKGVGKK